MKNYLGVLEDSLYKKLKLLDKIQTYNEAQYQVFSGDNVQIEKFDEYIEEKGVLIEQVLKLDEGFEALYANVAEELKGNRERYASEIRILQELIRQVTEKSVAVQAQEARNKALIESYFAKEKEQIGQGRRSSAVAYNYYANVNKAVQAQPQFMDSRQ
ncbi:MAG: flagellar protein FliT [Lachnospiraceae bacterium]|nr:flagellar protein FliT [Lachnospiraceae bacterium]